MVNILNQHEYKGIGVRFVAQIIDGIILMIIYFIVGYLMFGTTTWSATGYAAAPVFVVNGIIGILYFVGLEGTSGATIGKRVLKMRVVRENGSPCGLGAAFIRNILRIIDVLPFAYIIGVIMISRSAKKQRLGDSAAHTVVIGESSVISSTATPPQSEGYTQSPSESSTEVGGKFCISCGAKIPPEAAFCPKCGAKE